MLRGQDHYIILYVKTSFCWRAIFCIHPFVIICRNNYEEQMIKDSIRTILKIRWYISFTMFDSDILILAIGFNIAAKEFKERTIECREFEALLCDTILTVA